MTTFSFSTDAPVAVKAGVLILPVFQGPEFGPGVEETGLEQAYRDAKLTGKKGESLLVTKRDGDASPRAPSFSTVWGTAGSSTSPRCGRRSDASPHPSVGSATRPPRSRKR